jgi:hypothetical protein
MKARHFQFNLGSRSLGWPAKILLSFLALAGIALIVSFGLLAILFAVAVFTATKLMLHLRRALGLSHEPPPANTWEHGIRTQNVPDSEASVIVRDIEVEVLPAERLHE